jgi:hypothetical protein
MSHRVDRLETLDQLRDFVNTVLCQSDQLEIGAFAVSEQILVRGGRPCGIWFRLHGPRNVQLTAIWETDRNTILFYNSSGERFQKTELLAAPALVVHAA